MSSTRTDLTKFAWLSIAAALVTIALKTGAWLITGSVGLASDAAESVVNLVAAIVVGYEQQMIRSFVGDRRSQWTLPIDFIENPEYLRGSIVSLQKASNLLLDGAIYMDADVLYPPELLRRLVTSRHENCLATYIDNGLCNNGRDDAFVQPQPAQLSEFAAPLRAGGVRRLLVLVPHAPALLPQALKCGLASLDEAQVAALGFEQLLFVRAAQAAPGVRAAGLARRAAAAWLDQLAWMVPQREQPLRAQRLAELAVELLWRLPLAAPATRVLAPDLLWQAAHAADRGAWLDAWLAGAPLPQVSAPPRRW